MAGHRGRLSCPTTWPTPRITENWCPVFAIHHIPAFAAGQVSSAIHREEEARSVHAAPVSETFTGLQSDLVSHLCNPMMP